MRIWPHVHGSLRRPRRGVVLVYAADAIENTRLDPRQGLGEYVMSQSSAWIAMEKQYYAQTVRRQPVVLVRGEGCRVWDADGKEYLDLVAGWAVNNLGHCHPAVTHAIAEQADTLVQTSNQFYTVPQLLLAQLLVEHSCLERVFFGNSGAEANEGALKLARKYGKQQRGGAYEVITATNSFHGRTLATLAAARSAALSGSLHAAAARVCACPI